jgi:hypothetical protein
MMEAKSILDPVGRKKAREKSGPICPQCKEPMGKGRPDRKFCDADCRNAYHNKQKIFESKETKKIRLALSRNRKILRSILRDESELIVKREKLLKLGFEFEYHTHHRISKVKQYEYTFCFDYGYRDVTTGTVKIVKAFTYKDD